MSVDHNFKLKIVEKNDKGQNSLFGPVNGMKIKLLNLKDITLLKLLLHIILLISISSFV
jgi:hypothetical protein